MITIDIFLKIINIIFIIILTVLIHEASHWIVAKFDDANPKMHTNIISSWISYNPNKLKHIKLFFGAGLIGNIVMGLILYLIPYTRQLGLYNLIIGICNVIFIFPNTDIYRILDLDDKIKFTEDKLWIKGIWLLFGNFCVILSMILIIWKILW